VAVDELCRGGAVVAGQAANLLDGHAVGGHQADEGVPQVPWRLSNPQASCFGDLADLAPDDGHPRACRWPRRTPGRDPATEPCPDPGQSGGSTDGRGQQPRRGGGTHRKPTVAGCMNPGCG
jgi:hypothetical protein